MFNYKSSIAFYNQIHFAIKQCLVEVYFFSSYSHSHFESNAVFGLEEILADVAAMRLYRVRLILNDITVFSNNSGGGLDITQGRVDVVVMVTFEQNTAILGAAMRLFGRTEVSRRHS